MSVLATMDRPPSPHGRPVLRVLGAALVAFLSLRVAYLFAFYVLGSSVQRFHVESAALLFVAIGILVGVAVNAPDKIEPRPPATVPGWHVVVWCTAALLLYWPALSIGLLSDDFELVARAATWNLTAPSPILFRPLSLGAWALVLHAGGGSVALHLLNILLHGINAYLTVRIVDAWLPGASTSWRVMAGALVLGSPLGPEAVAWCSGVFDVSATTLVLLSVLTARKYESSVSAGTRVQFFALSAAAVLCKETAAVGIGLVLLDAWARGTVSKRFLIDAAVLSVAIAGFAVLRIARAAAVLTVFGPGPAMSRYMLQRGLFGPFGGLAVPWHAQLVQREPMVAFIGVLIVIVLSTMFFVEGGSRARFRTALAAGAWVLLPFLPVWPNTSVAPDLQSARYFYLPSIGWAMLVVMISEPGASGFRRQLSAASLIVLAALGLYGTRAHLESWVDAGRMRDRVEQAAARDEEIKNCPIVRLAKLPETVAGAYVFRNGVAEAFARDLRLMATVASGPGVCTFEWKAAEQRFAPFTAN